MDTSKDIQSEMRADDQLISDNKLIELYWQRNEQAISETDVKYGKLLYHIAFGILHDREDCDECKNDTYLGIWNAIPPTRPNLFAAFITKIMRSIAINRYHGKMTQKHIPTELTVSMDDLCEHLHDDNTPETEHDARELGKLISDFVRSLTDRQRYIFMERYYFVSTIDSIAGELCVGLATVHREIEKIKQGLRVHLERNGVNV